MRSSSSRSTPRRSPAKRNKPDLEIPARRSPFTDFGSYMEEKNRKLRSQFEAEASSFSSGNRKPSSSGDGKGIFHGVSIFVNGHTVPSSQELRAYMVRHGGRFEHYFSRPRVSHIICSNLPDSKMKKFKAFSRGIPVVKPAWVVDSVAANKLLSWTHYQLVEQQIGTYKQQKLSTFFRCKSISSAENAKAIPYPNTVLESKASEGSVNSTLPPDCNCLDSRMEESEGFACTGCIEELKLTKLLDVENVVKESDSSAVKLSFWTSSRVVEENIRDFPDTTLLRASDMQHSTLTDPNFVENYFKFSRLHFIGTWRNRYRKRFSSMLKEVESDEANVASCFSNKKACIIHIDMDSFFVSVVLKKYPALVDKPVAVCHSNSAKGTAEISSANYPAREYGIKAGMFMRDAKACCPNLIVLPYDFGAYEEVADQFYNILHKHCKKVQAVSCDEAFLDITECGDVDPENFAFMVRKEIAGTTQCTASAGIASNMLMARLATKAAKPNGQCFIPLEKVESFLEDLPISSLPGIGHALGEKLESRRLHSCGQLRMFSKGALHKDFGVKVGDMLWNYCRGIDKRKVEVLKEMKSIGAEVNWGVRFHNIMECEHFLVNLSKETASRLQECGMVARTINLKLKKRRMGSKEPVKFMGCGDCENMSRSMTLPVATDDAVMIQRMTKQIFASFRIDVKEVRGIGLQMSRLENLEGNRQGYANSTLQSWLGLPAKRGDESFHSNNQTIGAESPISGEGHWQHEQIHGISQFCINKAACSDTSTVNLGSSRRHESASSVLPPICHLDKSVLKGLPEEIFSEINVAYNGKLCDFMKSQDGYEKRKPNLSVLPTNLDSLISPPSREIVSKEKHVFLKGDIGYKGPSSGSMKDKQPFYSDVSFSDNQTRNEVLNQVTLEACIISGCTSSGSNSWENTQVSKMTPHRVQLPSPSCSELNILPIQSKVSADSEVTPHKLPSTSCLDLNILPTMSKACVDLAHLPLISLMNAVSVKKNFNENGGCNELAPCGFLIHSAGVASDTLAKYPTHLLYKEYEKSELSLWSGSPPNWVEKFAVGHCLILNVIAQLYTKAEDGLLSHILQSLISVYPLIVDPNCEEPVEAPEYLGELLMQYIHLKIDTNIEELYLCCRLLERLTSMSNVFSQVYNIFLPLLQDSVKESYGGKLHFGGIGD